MPTEHDNEGDYDSEAVVRQITVKPERVERLAELAWRSDDLAGYELYRSEVVRMSNALDVMGVTR